MRKIFNKYFYIFIGLVIGLLAVDMFSKIFTDNPGGEPVTVIPYLLTFISVHNMGIAFGMLDGAGVWLIIISSILSVGAVAAWVWLVLNRDSNKKMFLNISFAFFIAGAAGNLYDRIAHIGHADPFHVRDFIRFDFFPTFICNFADICLTAGTIMLAVYFIFFMDKKKEKEVAENAA